MAYWLFKSEPDVWSWEEQKAKGEIGEEWDGIRNYQARNNMRQMEIGDLGFFYHSNIGLEIVGIVEVCALAHPDSTTDDERWECVDVKAVCDMPEPVSLKQVKAENCPHIGNLATLLIDTTRMKPDQVALTIIQRVFDVLEAKLENLEAVTPPRVTRVVEGYLGSIAPADRREVQSYLAEFSRRANSLSREERRTVRVRLGGLELSDVTLEAARSFESVKAGLEELLSEK